MHQGNGLLVSQRAAGKFAVAILLKKVSGVALLCTYTQKCYNAASQSNGVLGSAALY